jgi:hypothetical protein
VGRVNDVGGDVAALVPPKPKEEGAQEQAQSSEAVVGGSTNA